MPKDMTLHGHTAIVAVLDQLEAGVKETAILLVGRAFVADLSDMDSGRSTRSRSRYFITGTTVMMDGGWTGP